MFVQKNFGLKKFFVLKKFWYRKNIGSQKFWIWGQTEGGVNCVVHHGESTLSTATFAHIPKFFSRGHRAVYISTL